MFKKLTYTAKNGTIQTKLLKKVFSSSENLDLTNLFYANDETIICYFHIVRIMDENKNIMSVKNQQIFPFLSRSQIGNLNIYDNLMRLAKRINNENMTTIIMFQILINISITECLDMNLFKDPEIRSEIFEYFSPGLWCQIVRKIYSENDLSNFWVLSMIQKEFIKLPAGVMLMFHHECTSEILFNMILLLSNIDLHIHFFNSIINSLTETTTLLCESHRLRHQSFLYKLDFFQYPSQRERIKKMDLSDPEMIYMSPRITNWMYHHYWSALQKMRGYDELIVDKKALQMSIKNVLKSIKNESVNNTIEWIFIIFATNAPELEVDKYIMSFYQQFKFSYFGIHMAIQLLVPAKRWKQLEIVFRRSHRSYLRYKEGTILIENFDSLSSELQETLEMYYFDFYLNGKLKLSKNSSYRVEFSHLINHQLIKMIILQNAWSEFSFMMRERLIRSNEYEPAITELIEAPRVSLDFDQKITDIINDWLDSGYIDEEMALNIDISYHIHKVMRYLPGCNGFKDTILSECYSTKLWSWIDKLLQLENCMITAINILILDHGNDEQKSHWNEIIKKIDENNDYIT